MKPLKEQIIATDPGVSIWLSASAGTGKTFVLVNRLIRLILEGNDPRRMVCITYTKAAATEMQERVIKYIGNIILLDDLELKTKLEADFEAKIDIKKLNRTRKKLINIIDHPEQLKIQTIHSFCQTVLKHFPLEADTPAFFEVIDDFTRSELVDVSWRKLMVNGGDETLGFLLSRFKGDKVKEILGAILDNKRKLFRIFENHGSSSAYLQELKTKLGVLEEDTSELEKNVFKVSEEYLQRLLRVLHAGGSNAKKYAAKLEKYFVSRKIDDLASALLTEKYEPKKLTTKESKDIDPAASEWAEGFQLKLIGLMEKIADINIYKNTQGFIKSFMKFHSIFEDEKRARYVLEFDDLIDKTVQLLHRNNPNREWVLYKLDGGIDHILIDEAQDTNENQWQIIEAISNEFFSGQATEEGLNRSLFVVGDDKQSIYSFQGADVRVFSEKQKYYEMLKREYEIKFEKVNLNQSFRSAPAVIDIVNELVKDEGVINALTKSGITPVHEVKPELKGNPAKFGYFEINKLVDEQVRAKPNRDAISWKLPREYEVESEARNIEVIAENIVKRIDEILNREYALGSTGRRPEPGDIMILVRKRNELTRLIIEKLQTRNIPVSGIDRMQLNDNLAIKDIIALAKFALLKTDDLNLACLLKSPFFGVSEEELFAICHGRRASVFERLKEEKEYYGIVERLEKLTGNTQSAFEFFYTALEVSGFRRRFIGYFGRQINEIIDEFLAVVKNFEENVDISLQHFINWFEKNEIEVKRNLNSKQGEVRIITVHGAKGLEAPIVITPDTTSVGRKEHSFIFAEGMFLCPVYSDYRNGLYDDIAKGRDALESEESQRLLYVALTRAKDELYVFGHKAHGAKADNWYNTILNAAGAAGIDKSDEARSIYTKTEYVNNAVEKIAHIEKTAIERVNGDFRPEEEMEVVSPSALYRTENEGKFNKEKKDFSKGLAVHKLLEILPGIAAEERSVTADRILKNYFDDAESEELEGVKREAITILENESFKPIFAGKAKAELPVCGFFGNRFISGKIDRLIDMGDEILIVDFKTNNISEGNKDRVVRKYSEQMSAYKFLIEKIYEGKNVRAALLFTSTGELVYV